MGRSPEKSASITVTIQPSRLADGEFFSSLLAEYGGRCAPIRSTGARSSVAGMGSCDRGGDHALVGSPRCAPKRAEADTG